MPFVPKESKRWHWPLGPGPKQRSYAWRRNKKFQRAWFDLDKATVTSIWSTKKKTRKNHNVLSSTCSFIVESLKMGVRSYIWPLRTPSHPWICLPKLGQLSRYPRSRPNGRAPSPFSMGCLPCLSLYENFLHCKKCSKYATQKLVCFRCRDVLTTENSNVLGLKGRSAETVRPAVLQLRQHALPRSSVNHAVPNKKFKKNDLIL